MSRSTPPSEAFASETESPPGDRAGQESERPPTSSSGRFSILWNTDSEGKTVADIQQEYSLQSRGLATAMLGFVKMSGSGGFPALVDVLAGLFLYLQEVSAAQAVQQSMGGDGDDVDGGRIDQRAEHHPNPDNP